MTLHDGGRPAAVPARALTLLRARLVRPAGRGRAPVDTSCRWGGGGLVSTTEDLVRFGAALLRGDILRRETLEAMFAPQKIRNGAETGYGLGWHVDADARGRRYVWHGGRGVGGRSAIVLVPHARLVTVMLSNIEGELLDEHARRITAFFLESVEASGGPPDLLRASGPRASRRPRSPTARFPRRANREPSSPSRRAAVSGAILAAVVAPMSKAGIGCIRRLKGALLLSALALLDYWPMLLGRVPFPAAEVTQVSSLGVAAGPDLRNRPHAEMGDLITEMYPWKAYTRRAVAGGTLPLWNPIHAPRRAFRRRSPDRPVLSAESPLLRPADSSGLVALVSRSVRSWQGCSPRCSRGRSARRAGGALAGVVFAFCGWVTAFQTRPHLDTSLWLPLGPAGDRPPPARPRLPGRGPDRAGVRVAGPRRPARKRRSRRAGRASLLRLPARTSCAERGGPRRLRFAALFAAAGSPRARPRRRSNAAGARVHRTARTRISVVPGARSRCTKSARSSRGTWARNPTPRTWRSRERGVRGDADVASGPARLLSLATGATRSSSWPSSRALSDRLREGADLRALAAGTDPPQVSPTEGFSSSPIWGSPCSRRSGCPPSTKRSARADP